MMPPELKEAKQDIRTLIKMWSTQKLLDVYAFNQDGKMRYSDGCCCLRGVHLSDVLHNWTSCTSQRRHDHHYLLAGRIPEALKAEQGYLTLGDHWFSNDCRFSRFLRWLGFDRPPRMIRRELNNDGLRQVRLSAILRAEIRLRSRENKIEYPQEIVESALV